ncbi:MAG: hypothetical protein ABIT08_01205 [Bacteroidia bacterium]
MRFLTKAAIPFIIFIVTWYTWNTQWGKDHWNDIIETDAKGYYAYLPAVFIYHDLNFGFIDSIEKKYYNPHTVYEFRTRYNGRLIDKYFAGTAVAEFPFFVCAHLISKITGKAADGYSKLYPKFINIGAIVYLMIGLVYIRRLLRTLEVKEGVIAFILCVIALGTNIFLYTVCEPGMSHVYSFAFISMFVYYSRMYFKRQGRREVLYCGLLTGIIILIRPVNGIILLALPFIAGSKEKFIDGINTAVKEKTILVFSFLAAIAVISIQLVIYKIQCGEFFVYAYGDEKINWAHPNFINFLFSYKKGFFVYTPVAFVSLAGFIYLWKKNHFKFYTLILFCIVIIYVLSSWHSWWYGGSFSSRVMIDYYVFLGLLLSFTFKLFESKTKKILLGAALTLLLFLCQVQTYQYRYYIIHWDNMTKEKYWDVFLKLPHKN